MYYACRSDSESGIYAMSKTIQGFAKSFTEGVEVIIYMSHPNTVDYGMYYTVQDGKVRRKKPQTLHDIGMQRMLGL